MSKIAGIYSGTTPAHTLTGNMMATWDGQADRVRSGL
jgi:hypothetical protein